jgi:hypothetical protein
VVCVASAAIILWVYFLQRHQYSLSCWLAPLLLGVPECYVSLPPGIDLTFTVVAYEFNSSVARTNLPSEVNLRHQVHGDDVDA